MTERVYPNEMQSSRALETLMKGVFLRRYGLARDWLREHFQGRSAKVLDIACGSGYGAAILAELGPVVAVDIDAEAIEYARKEHAGERISYVVGNADDAGFLASLGSFDAVVTSATLEHVANAEVFLRWIRGALLPGGVCIACFPSALTMDWAAPHHKRDISPQKAKRLFSQCGFRQLKEYHESHRLALRDLRAERRANPALPVPPLRRWVWYFARHPHHLAVRLHQISPLGNGPLRGPGVPSRAGAGSVAYPTRA